MAPPNPRMQSTGRRGAPASARPPRARSALWSVGLRGGRPDDPQLMRISLGRILPLVLESAMTLLGAPGDRPGVRAADSAVLALWIICAAVTLPMARSPGFVLQPESVPYPWGAVVITWILLALEAVVLRAVLRPARPGRLWIRLLASLVGLGILLLGVLQLGLTDQPGYSYVPGLFALLGLLLVCLFGLVRGVMRLRGKGGSSAPHAA